MDELNITLEAQELDLNIELSKEENELEAILDFDIITVLKDIGINMDKLKRVSSSTSATDYLAIEESRFNQIEIMVWFGDASAKGSQSKGFIYIPKIFGDALMYVNSYSASVGFGKSLYRLLPDKSGIKGRYAVYYGSNETERTYTKCASTSITYWYNPDA